MAFPLVVLSDYHVLDQDNDANAENPYLGDSGSHNRQINADVVSRSPQATITKSIHPFVAGDPHLCNVPKWADTFGENGCREDISPLRTSNGYGQYLGGVNDIFNVEGVCAYDLRPEGALTFNWNVLLGTTQKDAPNFDHALLPAFSSLIPGLDSNTILEIDHATQPDMAPVEGKYNVDEWHWLYDSSLLNAIDQNLSRSPTSAPIALYGSAGQASMDAFFTREEINPSICPWPGCLYSPTSGAREIVKHLCKEDHLNLRLDCPIPGCSQAFKKIGNLDRHCKRLHPNVEMGRTAVMGLRNNFLEVIDRRVDQINAASDGDKVPGRVIEYLRAYRRPRSARF